MKKIISIIAVVLLVSGLAACGGGSDSDDPNIGVWKATSAEMFGITSPVEEYFGKGFTIELKPKGKCALNVDGSKANGSWTLEDGAFTVKGGGFESAGRLENGKLTLEDVLGMGLTLVFEKEGGYAGAIADVSSDVGDADTGDSSGLQSRWDGTWYGVMSIIDGNGKYEDASDSDMYLVMDVDANGAGSFKVYTAYDLDEWVYGTCQAYDYGFDATDIEDVYNAEPMDISDWVFRFSPDYKDQLVTGNFIHKDNDGDEFEYGLYFKRWGMDWEDEMSFGRAAIYPPGYDEYMEKVTNGEPSPFGDGGGAAASGGSNDEPVDEPGGDNDLSELPAPVSGGNSGAGDVSFQFGDITVSATFPSGDWIEQGKQGSSGDYYVIFYYKNTSSASPRIEVRLKKDGGSFDNNIKRATDVKDIGTRTIDGLEMKGRSYTDVGMDWIDYIGVLNADNDVCIQISGVDINSGEGKALLDSIKFK